MIWTGHRPRRPRQRFEPKKSRMTRTSQRQLTLASFPMTRERPARNHLRIQTSTWRACPKERMSLKMPLALALGLTTATSLESTTGKRLPSLKTKPADPSAVSNFICPSCQRGFSINPAMASGPIVSQFPRDDKCTKLSVSSSGKSWLFNRISGVEVPDPEDDMTKRTWERALQNSRKVLRAVRDCWRTGDHLRCHQALSSVYGTFLPHLPPASTRPARPHA